MTTATATFGARRLPARLILFLRDAIVGSFLCLTPLTSLIVLGWLTRRMDAQARRRWGLAQADPGWLMGPRGSGWITRPLGSLAANIRAGVQTFLGLGLLTLPFTAIWLGAWWAGWENSFNKGYEQAAIGPVVWLTGALVAMVVLAHLPFALAHAAVERRIGAFFEIRKIRSIVSAAGWRGPFLALLSVVLSMPFVASRAAPVFIEGIVPGFAQMTFQEQQNVGGVIGLLRASYAFVALYVLRGRAAAAYAAARARIEGSTDPAVWIARTGTRHIPPLRRGARLRPALWLLLSCVIWFGLVVQIVASQFINYNPLLWLTHPVYLLPW